MRIPYLLAAAVVVIVAAVLGWLIQSDAPVREGGRPLRALYAIEPPFAFIDRNGRVTGEAPEVLRVLAYRAGLGEVEFVHAEFGQLMHELASGRGDVIASGLFATPERALRLRLRFTRPSALVGTGMLVAKGNPMQLHSFEDVAARSDAQLAVVDGAVEQVQASRAGVPAARIQLHGDAASAVVAVIEGRADAFALSDVSLHYMMANSGFTGVELATPFVRPQRDGQPDAGRPAFAVRPEDEALARRLDQAMAGYLGSAEHRALVAHFGFGVDNIAPAAGAR
jgi:polar amino acid transport system substrate-binding protein